MKTTITHLSGSKRGQAEEFSKETIFIGSAPESVSEKLATDFAPKERDVLHARND